MADPVPPPGRSVAAATWGKKGVTAKQRQAALRSSRLEPLSADEYQRQQAMLGDSGANSLIGSRRGSMDARVEQHFVRQHGLGGPGVGDADEGENEADMAPHSPLLSRGGGGGVPGSTATAAPSVKRFWSAAPIPAPSFDGGASMTGVTSAAAAAAAAQDGPLTPPPNKQYISRPARSRKRGEHLGASTGSVGVSDAYPSDLDGQRGGGTMQVTELLQGLKARQAAEADAEKQPLSPERPPNRQREEADEESQDVMRSAEKRRRDAADAAAAADSATAAAAAAAHPHDDPSIVPPPPISSSPCCGGLESLSCFSSFSSALSSLFGTGARHNALHEMRHGVVLPQDGARPSVAAIERLLAAAPPDCVLDVRVARADELEPHAALTHPMVKLHVLDLRTGTYWKKADPRRHAVAPYENLRGPGMGAAAAAGAGGKPDSTVGGVHAQATLLPIMSHPSPLRSAGSFLPTWDEHLLINEPLRHILRPETLFFFELLDFGPAVDLETYPTGQLPVAWAFLKALNARGEPNLGPNLRLQLYRYTNLGADRPVSNLFDCGAFGGLGGGGSVRDSSALQRADVPRVYYEWLWQKHTGRVLYPSTLYVGVGGVATPSREAVRGARPTLPTQVEEGRVAFPELLASSSTAMALLAQEEAAGAGRALGGALGRLERKQAVEHMTSLQRAALVRKRRIGDPCLLPTAPLHSISCGLQGCFALSYSPDGRTLAAACGDGLMFTLKLYDSDSGVQLHTYTGHHDLVHDIAWNCLGTALVSASADCTAKVWPVDATRQLPAHQLRPSASLTLQHTSFLYCAVWHPKLQSAHVVLTGGFDGVLRFWDTRPPSGSGGGGIGSVGSTSGELLHSIQGSHSAHINSVTFAPNGTRIFTADAAGVVNIWEDTLYTRAGPGAGGNEQAARSASREPSWSSRIRLLHTLAHSDLSGSVITCVRYHARPERLLVYTRDNCAYLFSLLRYELRARLTGVPSQQHSLRCALSPDGSKLVAGGEDGQAYFFDLDSGALEQVLDVGFRAPLRDVAWHPTQHCVALASFGGDYPIKVMEFRSGYGQGQGHGGGTTARMDATQQHQQGETARSQRLLGTSNAAAVAATNSGLPVSSSLPPSLRAQAQAQAAHTSAAAAAHPTGSGRRAGGPSLAGTRALADDDFDDDEDDIGGDSYRSALGASKRVHFGQK